MVISLHTVIVTSTALNYKDFLSHYSLEEPLTFRVFNFRYLNSLQIIESSSVEKSKRKEARLLIDNLELLL